MISPEKPEQPQSPNNRIARRASTIRYERPSRANFCCKAVICAFFFVIIIGIIVAGIYLGRIWSKDEADIELDSDQRKITDVIPMDIESLSARVINRMAKPVSKHAGTPNTERKMIRGAELRQIIVDCEEITTYGLKFSRTLAKKLMSTQTTKEELANEIEMMQNEIPLFPNDPSEQKKWVDYFAKPDIGAQGGISAK